MGLNIPAEIKLARKIIAKHSLTVPFDLEDLVRQYAELTYKPIPIDGVDGVSLNLKVIGKNPKIIVNSKLPQTRQLFTLAHEFGHVIIPWHIGTIVDEIYHQGYKDLIYALLEQEANRFASELLMPRDWILQEYNKNKMDIASIQKLIVKTVGVSDHAAAIAIIGNLPSGIIYIAEEKNKVLHTGKSEGSSIRTPPSVNENFKSNLFPYLKSHTIYSSSGKNYHWFDLNAEVNIATTDLREWREILHQIAEDIQPSEGIEKFKKSINGIISFAHGGVKMKGDYNINSVTAACLYRLERAELEKFTSHPDYKTFVAIRVKDFFNKK